MGVAYIAGCLLTALLNAYTLSFQGATLYWGKKLAPDNEYLPTGMQDAITPRAQTLRNTLAPILLIAVVAVGWMLFGVFVGFGALLATFVVGALIRILLPKPKSRFFWNQIVRSLVSRRAKYLAASDQLRAEAIDDLLTKLKELLPAFLESTKAEPSN